MNISCGLLMYKYGIDGLEVLLAHPGGPYWEGKDLWTIPKGIMDNGEKGLDTAKREFTEETNINVGTEVFCFLGYTKTQKGKVVYVWGFENDLNLDRHYFKSSTCVVEWPPGTGKQKTIVEVDEVHWFPLKEAREKIFDYQKVFLDRLESLIALSC